MATGKNKIKIGLFGFGRTGATVAHEMINAPDSELVWVVRKSTSHESEFASRLQGHDFDEGKIYWVGNIKKSFLRIIR